MAALSTTLGLATGAGAAGTQPATAAAAATPPAVSIVEFINGSDANASPGIRATDGSTLNVSFLVTNTGGVTLDPVKVTDDTIADITCPQTALDPGQQMTCTATTPAPAAGTVHTDTGTVVGTPSASLTSGTAPADVADSDSANAYVPTGTAGSTIQIVTSINGDDANTAPGIEIANGATMNLTFDVTNTGTVDLENVAVTDDMISAAGQTVTCPQTTLAVGEQMTCTATSPSTPQGSIQADVGTATATPVGSPAGSLVGQVTSSNPAYSYVAAQSGTGLTNTATLAAPPTQDASGVYTIKYLLSAANAADAAAGTYTLQSDLMFGTGITVQSSSVQALDPVGPVAVNPAWDGTSDGIVVTDQTIQPGGFQSYLVTATATVTPGGTPASTDCTLGGNELGTGFFNRSSFITGGLGVFTGACARPTPNPAVTVVKSINGNDANTAPGVVVDDASTMAVTYVVTNTGDIDLDPVTVTDDKIAATDISCPKTALTAGEQMTCTASAPAPPANVLHTDTASVVATPAVGSDGTVSADVIDSNPANAYVPAAPAVTIVKSINGDDANTAPGVQVDAGSTMNITFDVSNSGNVTLDPVAVTDDKVAAADISCPKTALAAGEEMTCTATAPAPAAGASHTDTGSVVGTPPTGIAGSAIADVTASDQANAHAPEAATTTTSSTAPVTTTVPAATTTSTTSTAPAETTTVVPATTTSTTAPAETTTVPETTTSTTVEVTTTSAPETTTSTTVAPAPISTPPSITRTPLARTGAALISMGLIGGGLIGGGLILRRRRRQEA